MNASTGDSSRTAIRISAECGPHACCWMAWAVRREWGKAAGRVKRELSEVIRTIARYEPVQLLARRGEALREARRQFATCANVAVIEAPVYDIWMRDIAPTFALRGEGEMEEVVGIDWNFNGWGETAGALARERAQFAKSSAAIFGMPIITAAFVAEGGALVTDGSGTMVTTRSCLLNPNRRRCGKDRQRMIETDLLRFGIRKTIWLEGDPCEPITSGHADGYVLFAPNGVVLVETYDDKAIDPPPWRGDDISLLENTSDADGRRLKIVRVLAPRQRYWKGDSETFALCYLNAYVANGVVITARFGDPERDEAAKNVLARAFSKREIVMLRIDAIADGGGGIHCLTQPTPLARKPVSKFGG